MKAAADPGFYADFGELRALKRSAREQDPQALREAARQFESIFARMMISSMRAASFGDSLLGSNQQDFYRGMFDDQLATELTKGRGLGLADLLVEQLTRAGLAPAPADPGAAAAAGTNEIAGAADIARIGESARAGAAGTAAPPMTREDFIRDLWPHAQAAGVELGVDPRTLIAHAALETGWGQSLPRDTNGRSSFNLFGIKASGGWSGAAVGSRTLEFENGVAVRRTERFRAYDSPAASFDDYVSLLRNNPRYTAALNTGSDAQAFATALQQGGYATDPAYASKLAAVAQTVDGLHAASSLKNSTPPPIPDGENLI